MDKDGGNKTQITADRNLNGTSSYKNTPKFYNGSIYYEQGGLVRYTENSIRMKLESSCNTYTISNNGEIVFGKFDYCTLMNGRGVLWIMNANGFNNRQLTFNNFKLKV